MSRVLVDVPKVIELMTACVEERGEDWVYPDQGSCRYFYEPEMYQPDGMDISSDARAMVAYFGEEAAPACLVGLALHKLDDRLDEALLDNNDQSIDGWMGDASSGYTIEVESDDEFVFTYEAICVMQRGQGAQDTGQPWGEALRRAREYAQSSGWLY